MAVFRSRSTMPAVRDVLMMLIIFKTNASVTGSKVSKGFQAVGFGEGKKILMVRIFSVIRKDIRKVVRVQC